MGNVREMGLTKEQEEKVKNVFNTNKAQTLGGVINGYFYGNGVFWMRSIVDLNSVGFGGRPIAKFKFKKCKF
ncbi:hypothetical protein [Lutibacter sp.]|uniref:hypothetical protein n=1 Tax=Lutibacter sp. TaxID=1925666 RepID=UPI0034A01DDE